MRNSSNLVPMGDITKIFLIALIFSLLSSIIRKEPSKSEEERPDFNLPAIEIKVEKSSQEIDAPKAIQTPPVPEESESQKFEAPQKPEPKKKNNKAPSSSVARRSPDANDFHYRLIATKSGLAWWLRDGTIVHMSTFQTWYT